MPESLNKIGGIKFGQWQGFEAASSRSPDESLSAVERFSIRHDQGHALPLNRHYKELMPASPPKPGQQYAFEVDLDRCTACKACVVACHNLNGLEEDETWRNTGLLIGGTSQQPFQQTVTATCHHCVDPACLNGCPVNAYEKDSITGIVKHLDDQCIGCKYCTLTCPYDVPTFSKSKGIVRKCDMCSDRLAVGDAPACVQSCPSEAILIKIVTVADVVERSEVGLFLPGAPSPELTIPTTTYISKNALPQNLLPADYYSVKREDSEWPLVFMLVLSQLSVGVLLWDSLLRMVGMDGESRPGHALYLSVAAITGWLALAASIRHLGRPLYAFRALLGLRRSWLSREILTMGLYVLLATAHAMTYRTTAMTGHVPSFVIHALESQWFRQSSFFGAVLSGGLGVFCSVMVYAFTRRELWRGAVTGFKFTTTTMLLGAIVVLTGRALSAGEAGVSDIPGRVLCLTVAIIAAAKLSQELSVLVHIKDTLHTANRRAATLLVGPLRNASMIRVLSGALGGIVMPVAVPCMVGGPGGLNASTLIIGMVVAGSLTLLAGEILERYLFFTTGVTPRMPGEHTT